MNETERYLFDLQGYVVVEHALTPRRLARLNAVMDEQIARSGRASQPNQRFDGLLSWGLAYRELIDNPRVTPYLQVLLGEQFRLDHEYAHIIRSGLGPIGAHLHGGGTPYDPGQYYTMRNGRMYNGLTTVAYNLTEVKPGEGGFGCIPSSHKSNLPLPAHWRSLEMPAECVRAVSAPAGSAIIFTEALTHGTLPWKGAGDRRTVFYKYSPFPSAWSRQYYDLAQFPDLTDEQRSRLKPPGVSP